MKHRILYCSLLYDYGEPQRGFSYEYYNIENGLKECSEAGMFDLEIFHIDKMRIDLGKQEADLVLMHIINDFEPNILFHTSFNDALDIDHNTLKWAKNKDIITMEWCPDTSWRFLNYLLPRKDLYTYFITTHAMTVPWFKEHNMKVIKSQWAGSSVYKKWDQKQYQYDISFVGQKHGIRPQIIDALTQHNISVHLFGNYWDGYLNNHGFISFDKMIEVFNTSKINLNLSNPFQVGTIPQLKGRVWEINQCGGFQITTPADDIESYFVPDKEIVIVDNMLDMVNKIRYYLEHNEEREQIAEAGYQRMLKEHQWKYRFIDILKEINHDS